MMLVVQLATELMLVVLAGSWSSGFRGRGGRRGERGGEGRGERGEGGGGGLKNMREMRASENSYGMVLIKSGLAKIISKQEQESW